MKKYRFVVDGDYVIFYDHNLPYRLHKNSRDIEWSYDETGAMLWEIRGVKFRADDITDVEIDGDTLATNAEFGTAIAAIFPGYAGGGSAGYLVYTALLSQSGTDAPTAVVLANTLGGTVVWTRGGQGSFAATLAGAFPVNKCWFSALINWNQQVGTEMFAFFDRTGSDDALQLTVLDIAGAQQDGFALMSIEIRVYP